ncbi:glycerophosphodiester phosphodiesterase [Paenibacillus chungangensis]|uniref:Glycerophosphodiester phosphodiesterase n=1 Tax=Paenibacillus chungangensis TaxID=696535 RepID=A0ABW3HM19_9BACL
MKNPCVAHRGWSSRAPENTMAAFQLAIDAKDIEWIECDVQLSRDGVPVVIHDYNLRRTTNGRGDVRSWTAAELASLDAGGWFSPQFKGESIPTLEELLTAAAGRCKLNIELKTDGVRYPSLEEEVLQLIREHHAEADVVITSFHAGALHKLRGLTSVVRTGLIVDGWRSTLIEELEGLGADFLSIGYSKLNGERMERLKEAGIQTMAWTVNDKRLIRKLTLLGPELLICTNYPDRWREVAGQERVSGKMSLLKGW